MIADETVERLEALLARGAPTVAVMGMGYVGLPLAISLVAGGCDVHGLDVQEVKIRSLNEGRSYVRDIPDQAVRQSLETGRFAATADVSVLLECDAIFICVPTPFTLQKEPDIRHIAAAAGQIAAHCREGQVVILRSTSYPGTTEEVVRPILEQTGLRVGREIFLAFAPERIDPGNTRFTVDQVPVVVGGCDPQSTRLASALLGRVAGRVVPVTSPAAAEMTKLLENVFRNVNIALVNQVAQLCDRMGLDVWEVVEAAATKPFGFMSFMPGLVGGHCIPVDPYYLAWKAREFDFHMDFIEIAARVNEAMPFFVVNKLLLSLHDNGSRSERERVLVLGVAFKKDVDDARYSPALKIMQLLRTHKIDVVYHDPYVPEVRLDETTLRSQPLTRELVASADCVLILTDHTCFDYPAILDAAHLVFDTRNALKAPPGNGVKVVKL